MKTLFEVKQGVQTIGEQLAKVESEITEKAIDPKASSEEITELNQTKATLKQKFDILTEQHNQMEAEQRASLAKGQFTQAEEPSQKVIDAKAELIRKTMAKESVSTEVYQALGDNDASGGGKFLPKNVSTDIIVEPAAKNPLRNLSTVTAITNLEIPKIAFTIDDDDFIEDEATAKEIKAKGDTVTFGRHKFKVFTDISETILMGTNTNLVSTVEANLQSGVATKEKRVAFATAPKKGEEHMSFYNDTVVGIKEVTGKTMYDGIINALGDLADEYAENASVTMKRSEYLKMIKELANGGESLFGKKPEEVLGYPVEFCDLAVTPVVGQFDFSHFNYDLNALYETDKNIKTGMNSFVVTAWFDHQIKLASAFRRVKITP